MKIRRWHLIFIAYPKISKGSSLRGEIETQFRLGLSNRIPTENTCKIGVNLPYFASRSLRCRCPRIILCNGGFLDHYRGRDHYVSHRTCLLLGDQRSYLNPVTNYNVVRSGVEDWLLNSQSARNRAGNKHNRQSATPGKGLLRLGVNNSGVEVIIEIDSSIEIKHGILRGIGVVVLAEFAVPPIDWYAGRHSIFAVERPASG